MTLRTRMKRIARVLILSFLFALVLLSLSGCSQLRPTAKSQTQTVLAFGLPALAIVSETHMDATNYGDDENQSKLEATNDITPEVQVPLGKD